MAAKKKITTGQSPWRLPPLNRQLLLRVAMIAAFLALAPLMYPTSQSLQYGDFHVGMVSDREIIAPFDFEINKSDEELEQERIDARAQVDPTVFINERVTDQQLESVSDFIDRLRYMAQTLHARGGTTAAADSLRRYFLNEYRINLQDRRWGQVLRMNAQSLTQLKTRLTGVLRDILSVGVLDRPKLFYGTGVQLNVRRNNFQELLPVNDFYDLDEARAKISERLRIIYTLQSDTLNVAYEILTKFLNPNVVYDEERTEALRNEAVAKVPLARGFVLAGQRIVDEHEVVTEEIYQKVQSLRSAISERNTRNSRIGFLGPYLWRILFTAFLLGVMLVFLHSYRPQYFYNHKKIFIILLIFLGQYVAWYLILTQFPQDQPWPPYLAPVPIASMLLTIIFDSGVGFLGTVILSVGVGSMFGLEYSVAVYTFFCGAVVVIAVRKLRQRSQFFGASWYLLLTSFFSIAVIEMLQSSEWRTVFEIFVKSGLPVCLVAPMITWGILYFLEWAFHVTTNMTLLELSDLNKPLLRLLQMKAPGTYHHSLMVSNLAEQAAETIGANSLLVRVGAYYHDIGKMVKPEYFTENQEAGENPHDTLAPRMSSLVIAAHVREGIELAQQYKLPEEIITFIPEHHGTNKISFFYNLASSGTDPKYLNEEDFRYPGPRPQSRETGILMLADGVEAMGRSLKNPNPAKIREMIRTIVETRFRDGELDDCDLTLRDMSAIAESFARTLSGVKHHRVEYPTLPVNGKPEQEKPTPPEVAE